MSTAEKVLVLLLRAAAVMMMLAVVPAVMPFAWMEAVSRYVGLEELPNAPIVDYLTRSLSAIYALHGALILFLSFDVQRYLPVIKCLIALGFVFGIGMLVLDFAVELPLMWTLCEGPFILIMCLVLWLLAGRVDTNGVRSG